MRQVTDHELDQLANASPSMPLTFFGIALGIAVAFGTVIFTQDTDAKGYDQFVALFWLGMILSAYFGVRSIQAHRAGRQLLREIRK